MSAHLCWEDIKIGTEVPPLVKEPTSEQLVRWAGASGDFYPIHYDIAHANAHKLPGLIIHGALKSAWLGEMLIDWIGENGRIKRYGCSYHKIDIPGDILICRGTITGKHIEGDEHLVACDIWIDNSKGERTTSGTALVVFPSRDSSAD